VPESSSKSRSVATDSVCGSRKFSGSSSTARLASAHASVAEIAPRVWENVLLPIEIYGLDRKRYEEKAHRLLQTAGLEGFLGKYPFELSGGMQQRVALCRALVAEPSLLLMDEPFGSLDALTRQKMGFELLRLWQEWKSTVLFVTHDIVESIMLADRVVVMSPRPGRIIDVVPVDLPRPRDVLMQDTPAFTALASRIRRRLWEEEPDV